MIFSFKKSLSALLRIDCSEFQGPLNVYISEACGYTLSISVIILSTFFKCGSVFCPFIIALSNRADSSRDVNL